MSDKHTQLKESLIRYLGLNKKPYNIFYAKVRSVQDYTCGIEVSDIELSGVSLCATINESKNNLIIKPKIGSDVLVADLSGGEFRTLVVIQYTEVESISLNGGKLGGLIKIQELTDKINELVDWCKNHTHSNASFTGTISNAPATGTLTIPKSMNPLNELNKADYEDTKILH